MTTGDSRVVIGIAGDLTAPAEGKRRIEVGMRYVECVRRAGGVPMVLAPMVELIPEQLRLCDGFVITGGKDVRMEAFGGVTHPKAETMHPDRQAYDTALLRALRGEARAPTLGVCLGMQMMALEAGGDLEQHLPDVLPTAEEHHGDRRHGVRVMDPWGRLDGAAGRVASWHHQAVKDAGVLKVLGRSEDGVIEAIGEAGPRFYVGVQWHPERTEDEAVGQAVFDALVRACRVAKAGRGSGGVGGGGGVGT